MTPYLTVRNIRKEYPTAGGHANVVLDGISLDVGTREFMTIVGPSGSGKTTLLKIAAGLTPATSGEVAIEGRRIEAPPAEIVYLSQQYTRTLFPWRTVRQNVEFPLEGREGLGRGERTERAMVALTQVGLGDVGDHYPWQLSGGMQQRVSIARALAVRPALLLLDEAFSSVDALTRMELQDLVLETWHEHALTVMLVTHDIEEAIYLSDRVAVMTRSPARLAETVVIDLPRPRHQLATRDSPRFIELRHHLFDLVLQPAMEVSR